MIEVAKKKLYRCFFSTLSGITNIYSQLQHVYYKALSFCYQFVNYCFYIVENVIDIFVFLDFLLLMIGRLFKYLFLSFFPLLAYLRFIVTVIFDNFVYINNFSSNFTNSYLESINKLQASLCSTNNVFLFGQGEIISVSTTPGSTMTSYKSLIFCLIVTIFSSIFYKKIILKSQSKSCPFLFFYFFNSCPPHKLKSNDLKCCLDSEYF